MKKIIYNLRNKPEHVRVQILHISTIAGAIILILLWILTLGNKFKNTDKHISVEKELAPLSVIKDNFNGYKIGE